MVQELQSTNRSRFTAAKIFTRGKNEEKVDEEDTSWYV